MAEETMVKCKGCLDRQKDLDCALELLKIAMRLNDCVVRALELATTPQIVVDGGASHE